MSKCGLEYPSQNVIRCDLDTLHTTKEIDLSLSASASAKASTTKTLKPITVSAGMLRQGPGLWISPSTQLLNLIAQIVFQISQELAI